MVCERCGRPLTVGSDVCENCGIALTQKQLEALAKEEVVATAVEGVERRCSGCGEILSESANYCPNCGKKYRNPTDVQPVEVKKEEKLFLGINWNKVNIWAILSLVVGLGFPLLTLWGFFDKIYVNVFGFILTIIIPGVFTIPGIVFACIGMKKSDTLYGRGAILCVFVAALCFLLFLINFILFKNDALPILKSLL